MAPVKGHITDNNVQIVNLLKTVMWLNDIAKHYTLTIPVYRIPKWSQ